MRRRTSATNKLAASRVHGKIRHAGILAAPPDSNDLPIMAAVGVKGGLVCLMDQVSVRVRSRSRCTRALMASLDTTTHVLRLKDDV